MILIDNLLRIIDANVNRAAEGIRLLEDVSRFYYNNTDFSEKFKLIRHKIRKDVMSFIDLLIKNRDSINDCGYDISQKIKIDDKKNLLELIVANFKRTEESIRVVEETLKVMGNYEISKKFETYRFQIYTMEKEFINYYYYKEKVSKLNTDIYCITSWEHSNGRSNIDVVDDMLKAGVKVIQYREKNKSLKDKLYECRLIREMTLNNGCIFIVNDDIDIALMVKADGVHVGQDDFEVSCVRALFDYPVIVGVSTHSIEQLNKAIADGADYIGVGPIYKTYTKKNVCDPVGLEYLEYAVKNASVPFVAIGGIKEDNIHEVLEKGARLIALVTEIVGADSIGEKIKSIRNKIQNYRG